MRRLALASALLLSACATRPQQPETVTPATITMPQPAGNRLMGMTPSELVSELGNPALQIREGQSVKLQFRNQLCVLDAYLYPTASGSGTLRVTHIDTRAPTGADTNQAACVFSLHNAR